MIAKNYIKYPEALRFQCEMFSNGYHNSPRIMRLMEVVFSWTPSIPAWWQALKNAENLLIKGWKKMQYELFGKKGEIVTKTDPMMTIEPFKETVEGRWKISLQTNPNNKQELDRCSGLYRSICRTHQTWAVSRYWHQGYSNHSYECDKGVSNYV